MRVYLHDTHIRVSPGVGANGAQGTGVLSGQRDEEMSVLGPGPDKVLDGFDGSPINAPIQVERGGGGDAAPFPIGLCIQGFVIELHLVGGFQNGGGASVGALDVTGRVFVRGGQDIHPGLIGVYLRSA